MLGDPGKRFRCGTGVDRIADSNLLVIDGVTLRRDCELITFGFAVASGKSTLPKGSHSGRPMVLRARLSGRGRRTARASKRVRITLASARFKTVVDLPVARG